MTNAQPPSKPLAHGSEVLFNGARLFVLAFVPAGTSPAELVRACFFPGQRDSKLQRHVQARFERPAHAPLARVVQPVNQEHGGRRG